MSLSDSNSNSVHTLRYSSFIVAIGNVLWFSYQRGHLAWMQTKKMFLLVGSQHSQHEVQMLHIAMQSHSPRAKEYMPNEASYY